MGFLDGIEKIINEHGSAVILKERIQLLNDRYAALEQRCIAAESQRDLIAAELEALRAKAQTMQAEIDEVRRLQNQADKERQENSTALPADRVAVLVAICNHPDIQSKDIAELVGVGAQMAQWHVDCLEGMGFVHVNLVLEAFPYEPGGRFLTLTAAGRAYLAEHGLL